MFFIKRLILKMVDKVKYSSVEEIERQLRKVKKDFDSKVVELNDKQAEITNKEENIRNLEGKIKGLETHIQELKNKEKDTEDKLKQILDNYNDIKDYGPEIPGTYGLYEPKYNLNNSILYKEMIDRFREQQSNMISKKEAVIVTNDWTVNNSKREGNKLLNRVRKLGLRAFNGECDAIISSIKYYSKYEARKQRIRKSYETINELLNILNMRINEKYLGLKFAELDLVFEYERKLQEEREALAKQRETERDEELAKKEYERELKRIEKEKNHYQNELDKMKEEILKIAEKERDNYEKKIATLMDKIRKLEDEKQTFKNLFENKAGYVYIISNIGSFGEDIFKIGTTRRLDPYERINELSNASVPFRFDPHALIFSENCYALENDLHQYFNNHRMNKVNNHKEFFRIVIDEIEKYVKRKDSTTKFIKIPEAIEYRASLQLIEKEKISNKLS